MRTLLNLLMLSFTLSGHAQSWCPTGAMWTHAFNDLAFGGQHGVTRIVYEGDTMIDGQTAQKLRATTVSAPWGSTDYQVHSNDQRMFTRYTDDVVYQWSSWENAFDTLMWFSAAPGQFWSAPGNNDPFYRILVLDTATVSIDGVSLRRSVVRFGAWEGLVPDTLYERIGFSINYLDAQTWFLTDQPWTGIRCYRDAELEYAAPNAIDCDFTLAVTERASTAVHVHPNPGSDRFSLNLPSGSHTVEVRDISGNLVHHTTLMDGMPVDASSWLPGTYLVRLPELGRSFHWVKQ